MGCTCGKNTHKNSKIPKNIPMIPNNGASSSSDAHPNPRPEFNGPANTSNLNKDILSDAQNIPLLIPPIAQEVKYKSPDLMSIPLVIPEQNGIEQPIKQAEQEIILMTNCYFFGIEKVPQIVKFDPINQAFSAIMPPANMQILNFSSLLYLSEATIYISGGLREETMIANNFYQYNAITNSALILPPCIHRRFAHHSNQINDTIYVIGGIGENHQNLKTCERYSIIDKRWSPLGDLNLARAFATSVVYNGDLYVFGGTTGTENDEEASNDNTHIIDPSKFKHSRKIEKYYAVQNIWKVLNVKLPKGIDNYFACCVNKDEIQILGGQTETGCLNANMVINLKQGTYGIKKFMSRERVAHKGMVHQASIWIFGGDVDDTIEQYDIVRNEWNERVSSHKSIINDIKNYGYTSPPLHIRSGYGEESNSAFQQSDPNDKKCLLFGDDFTSFILEINFTKRQIKENPIPLNLNLYGYQGVVKLYDGKYFLNGGMDNTNSIIPQNTYLYSPHDNTAVKLAKSNYARYTFNLFSKDNYVYAIGGRSWGDDEIALMKYCERYSLVDEAWEKIGNLNEARCSAMVFEYKGQLLVAGGYAGDKVRCTSIERYNEEKNIWELVNVELKVGLETIPPTISGLEGSCVIPSESKGSYYFIGGRTDINDSSKVWELNLKGGTLQEIGNLEDSKSLHKIYEYDKGKICVFGGENRIVEFYDIKAGITNELDFANQIEEAINKMFYLTLRYDVKLIRQGLA